MKAKLNVEKSSVKEWLGTLSEGAMAEQNGKLSKRLYRLVAVPRRRRRSVNLSKIALNTKEGDNVVVPGKVLSSGKISHSVNIAAVEFSADAVKGLRAANCKVVGIREMLGKKGIRIVI